MLPDVKAQSGLKRERCPHCQSQKEPCSTGHLFYANATTAWEKKAVVYMELSFSPNEIHILTMVATSASW